MYQSIRRYKIGAGSMDELMRIVNEGAVPIIRSVPGFIAYYVLDAGENVIASISVFEDQAGADESNRRAADWVRENIAAFQPSPPEITAGEVRVHSAR
jgi:heme-degrading monooxygenase HmoA